ncbi:MAG: hypothetical protein KF726_02015 [Anaerolineae bacterium]|nr:hypothetical protein [Anaerolineae bacterium]
MARDVTIGSKKYRPYLPLGTNVARNYGVGVKVTLLDIARSYRLPVPASFVLFDTAYRDALDFGLIRIDEATQGVITERADRLISSFNLPNFNWEFPDMIALRSAFSVEAHPDLDFSDRFASRLNVNAKDTLELATALCDLWTAALGYNGEGELRRDVLFMGMINAKAKGSATTEAAYEDDLIHIDDGTPAGSWIALPKLGRWARPESSLPDWQARLQTLLRNVRAHFNNRRTGFDWDIDWADDGAECWILRIAPATGRVQEGENVNLPSRREAK